LVCRALRPNTSDIRRTPLFKSAGRTCHTCPVEATSTSAAILDSALAAWNAVASLFEKPPAVPIKLWQHKARTIYVENGWGPPVPYPAVARFDGRGQNHGYRPVKGNREATLAIPEVVEWPELAPLALAINDAQPPVETVGCEAHFFPNAGDETDPCSFGSYVGLIFTDRRLNSDPKPLLAIAAHLAAAMDGCEKWWCCMELGLERLKGLLGVSLPWGLQIKVTNRGRSEQETRKHWGHSLARVGDAVSSLPSIDVNDT
jgi:hypothetical protein